MMMNQSTGRPSRDELCMQIAQLVAHRGTCSRAKVGAAIARDGRILVTGYNGPPAGLPHCTDPGGCNNLDRVAEGGCVRAVHAEANAIAYAARYGISTQGADLYCTHLPCRKCAELVVNSGIRAVYYDLDYRVKDGLNLLTQAGVQVYKL